MQDSLPFIERELYFAPSTEQIQEILSISPRFSRLKNLKEWQQETEQELVQASRAQWLYGYEIYSTSFVKPLARNDSVKHPQCLLTTFIPEWSWPRCLAHIWGLQSFSPRWQDSLSLRHRKDGSEIELRKSQLVTNSELWHEHIAVRRT